MEKWISEEKLVYFLAFVSLFLLKLTYLELRFLYLYSKIVFILSPFVVCDYLNFTMLFGKCLEKLFHVSLQILFTVFLVCTQMEVNLMNGILLAVATTHWQVPLFFRPKLMLQITLNMFLWTRFKNVHCFSKLFNHNFLICSCFYLYLSLVNIGSYVFICFYMYICSCCV